MILWPKKSKYVLFLLVCAAFTVAGVLMVRGGDAMGWLAILCFGFGVIVFCVLLLPGSAYLKLDGAGFTFCSLFRSHTLRWYEIASFGTARIGRRKLVGFNFSQFHRGQGRMRKISSAISGYEAALPDTYGMKTEDLAALMNDWRQRSASSRDA